MGKVVVKRFPDDKLFGAGAAAMASWANRHNARVISQSASGGWLIVTFEVEDKWSFENDSTFIPMSSSTTIREATDEELREMRRADKRLKDHPGKVTITYLDDPDEGEPEKPKKKRWWKRR
jgi:hypothetical protein